MIWKCKTNPYKDNIYGPRLLMWTGLLFDVVGNQEVKKNDDK